MRRRVEVLPIAANTAGQDNEYEQNGTIQTYEHAVQLLEREGDVSEARYDARKISIVYDLCTPAQQEQLRRMIIERTHRAFQDRESGGFRVLLYYNRKFPFLGERATQGEYDVEFRRAFSNALDGWSTYYQSSVLSELERYDVFFDDPDLHRKAAEIYLHSKEVDFKKKPSVDHLFWLISKLTQAGYVDVEDPQYADNTVNVIGSALFQGIANDPRIEQVSSFRLSKETLERILVAQQNHIDLAAQSRVYLKKGATVVWNSHQAWGLDRFESREHVVSQIVAEQLQKPVPCMRMIHDGYHADGHPVDLIPTAVVNILLEQDMDVKALYYYSEWFDMSSEQKVQVLSHDANAINHLESLVGQKDVDAIRDLVEEYQRQAGADELFLLRAAFDPAVPMQKREYHGLQVAAELTQTNLSAYAADLQKEAKVFARRGDMRTLQALVQCAKASGIDIDVPDGTDAHVRKEQNFREKPPMKNELIKTLFRYYLRNAIMHEYGVVRAMSQREDLRDRIGFAVKRELHDFDQSVELMRKKDTELFEWMRAYVTHTAVNELESTSICVEDIDAPKVLPPAPALLKGWDGIERFVAEASSEDIRICLDQVEAFFDDCSITDHKDRDSYGGEKWAVIADAARRFWDESHTSIYSSIEYAVTLEHNNGSIFSKENEWFEPGFHDYLIHSFLDMKRHAKTGRDLIDAVSKSRFECIDSEAEILIARLDQIERLRDRLRQTGVAYGMWGNE